MSKFQQMTTKILNVHRFDFYSSASNRIIHARDHASIQLAIADVDPITGRMSDTSKMYAICGAIRRMVRMQYFYKKKAEQLNLFMILRLDEN